MEKAMLFDKAAVTLTEQAGEAAAPKALPSHRLHYEALLPIVRLLTPLRWLSKYMEKVLYTAAHRLQAFL